MVFSYLTSSKWQCYAAAGGQAGVVSIALGAFLWQSAALSSAAALQGAPRSARTIAQVRHYACVYQAAACVLQSSPVWAGRCQTLRPSCIGGFAGLAQHDTGPVTECGFVRYVWAAKEAYPQTYFREPVIACLACTGDQAGVVYGSAHGQFRQGGAGRGQLTAP